MQNGETLVQQSAAIAGSTPSYIFQLFIHTGSHIYIYI